MERKNNPVLSVALVMVPLCAVLSLVLAAVNHFTAPKIAEADRRSEEAAYAEISEGWAIVGMERGPVAVSGNDAVKSYLDISRDSERGVIVNLSGKGYGGAFSMAAAFDSECRLLGSKMLSNSETPGLGKKSEEKWYMDIFKGRDPLPRTKSDLSDESAQAVSGATVTFTGVASALGMGKAFAKEHLK